MDSTIIQDIRLINLYSKNAELLNDTMKSNVIFNFKNILKDDANITNCTIGVVSAQIPVSWYIINSTNNILKVNALTITLTKGNYNSSQLITELQTQFIAVGLTDLTVSINKLTCILTFTNVGPFTFFFSGSTLFNIIGLKPTENYVSTSNIIVSTYPLNLLGIHNIKINSNVLSCFNTNSNNLSESKSISHIPNNASSFGMIFYINTTSFCQLKAKYISAIDIQILDDDNTFIDFNNINWNLTLQLTISKKIPQHSNNNMDAKYLIPILDTLSNIQADLDPPPAPPPTPDAVPDAVPDATPPLDSNQTPDPVIDNTNQFETDDNSLDILLYNNLL